MGISSDSRMQGSKVKGSLRRQFDIQLDDIILVIRSLHLQRGDKLRKKIKSRKKFLGFVQGLKKFNHKIVYNLISLENRLAVHAH